MLTLVVLHNTSNLRQGVYSGLSEALLDEAEAPVGGKLGVACDQEVKVQIVVELVHGPPGTIPEHKLVIILATAVNTLQVHTGFPNSVVGEEMVHVVDCTAAFAGWHTFINQVVDLLWYSFTADTKQATLAKS